MLLNGLETERLKFRNIEESDLEIWREFANDAEAVKFFQPIGDPVEFAKQWIERALNRYVKDGIGLYALIEKKSNEFVGQCGLIRQVVDDIPELEIGYHLLPKFWHCGFASEAAIACKKFAFDNHLSDSLISIIDPGNIASQKVAIRNGMSLDKQTIWHDIPVLIFRIKNEPFT
jgi:RimJ/RimL family protein N-acetyltransferase